MNSLDGDAKPAVALSEESHDHIGLSSVERTQTPDKVDPNDPKQTNVLSTDPDNENKADSLLLTKEDTAKEYDSCNAEIALTTESDDAVENPYITEEVSEQSESAKISNAEMKFQTLSKGEATDEEVSASSDGLDALRESRDTIASQMLNRHEVQKESTSPRAQSAESLRKSRRRSPTLSVELQSATSSEVHRLLSARSARYSSGSDREGAVAGFKPRTRRTRRTETRQCPGTDNGLLQDRMQGLKYVFMHYCACGDPLNNGRIGCSSLVKLVKDAGLLDNKLSKVDIELVYTRALFHNTRRHPDSSSKDLPSPSSTATARMSVDQYIDALHVLAERRLPDLPPDEAFRVLVDDYVLPRALRAEPEPSLWMVNSQEATDFMILLSNSLKLVFDVYAQRRNNLPDSKAGIIADSVYPMPQVMHCASRVNEVMAGRTPSRIIRTMDISDFINFATDFQFTPDPLPLADLAKIFRDVNLGGVPACEGYPALLSFGEFCVAVGMCAFAFFASKQAEGSDGGHVLPSDVSTVQILEHFLFHLDSSSGKSKISVKKWSLLAPQAHAGEEVTEDPESQVDKHRAMQLLAQQEALEAEARRAAADKAAIEESEAQIREARREQGRSIMACFASLASSLDDLFQWSAALFQHPAALPTNMVRLLSTTASQLLRSRLLLRTQLADFVSIFDALSDSTTSQNMRRLELELRSANQRVEEYKAQNEELALHAMHVEEQVRQHYRHYKAAACWLRISCQTQVNSLRQRHRRKVQALQRHVELLSYKLYGPEVLNKLKRPAMLFRTSEHGSREQQSSDGATDSDPDPDQRTRRQRPEAQHPHPPRANPAAVSASGSESERGSRPGGRFCASGGQDDGKHGHTSPTAALPERGAARAATQASRSSEVALPPLLPPISSRPASGKEASEALGHGSGSRSAGRLASMQVAHAKQLHFLHTMYEERLLIAMRRSADKPPRARNPAPAPQPQSQSHAPLHPFHTPASLPSPPSNPARAASTSLAASAGGTTHGDAHRGTHTSILHMLARAKARARCKSRTRRKSSVVELLEPKLVAQWEYPGPFRDPRDGQYDTRRPLVDVAACDATPAGRNASNAAGNAAGGGGGAGATGTGTGGRLGKRNKRTVPPLRLAVAQGQRTHTHSESKPDSASDAAKDAPTTGWAAPTANVESSATQVTSRDPREDGVAQVGVGVTDGAERRRALGWRCVSARDGPTRPDMYDEDDERGAPRPSLSEPVTPDGGGGDDDGKAPRLSQDDKRPAVVRDTIPPTSQSCHRSDSASTRSSAPSSESVGRADSDLEYRPCVVLSSMQTTATTPTPLSSFTPLAQSPGNTKGLTPTPTPTPTPTASATPAFVVVMTPSPDGDATLAGMTSRWGAGTVGAIVERLEPALVASVSTLSVATSTATQCSLVDGMFSQSTLGSFEAVEGIGEEGESKRSGHAPHPPPYVSPRRQQAAQHRRNNLRQR